MNFRIIKTVIGREYTTRVKKKSFLLTTFLVPVLIAAVAIVMGLIMAKTEDRAQNVAVIDQSGISFPFLVSGDVYQFTDRSGEDPEALKGTLEEDGYSSLVLISPLDSVDKTVSVQIYSPKPAGVEFSSAVARMVEDAVEDYRIGTYEIDNLAQIMKDVKSDVKVTEYTLDAEGNETVTESGVYMVLSMILGLIIFMFITMFSAMVMSSVIEEKASRVVEVLISSAKATELMFGKIIGVALVALTQFLLWIVLSGIIIGAIGGAAGLGFLSDGDNARQVMEMAQSMGGVSPEQMESLGITAAADTTAVAGPDNLEVLTSTLSHIPWGTMIIAFIIYFILGYLLYASFFAAIGSAVENEADSSQLQIPLTIPLMIGYMILFMAFRNPDSSVVVWGSMIPFTSPIVMLARIPFGVPVWQLILSIALLLVTFIGSAWVSAKIYKVGILVFGKKSTFKDLWNWLKQK
ncbi:MAG: ABC transporter permease [Bacteroidales bacterium]|nr:ABC transporter permease [Bacteroidales bacterium]